MQEFANADFLRSYTDRLVEAEVIAPVGYGKGLPVFLPWGLTILSRLTDLFREEFERNSPLEIHVPSTLIDADRYDAEVADFGGYDNIYRLESDRGEFVVRPDAAVANLSLALELKNERSESTVLSVFQGFRRIKGATPPLFRDRCIWPFIQLNRIVEIAQRERAVADILESLVRFFKKLCLPVRIIHVGPWKNYARDLYDIVMVTPGGTPTILAMFFVVGESYRRAAAIPENYEAFDVGVTEKTISALLLSFPGEIGLVLPSGIAPVEVVIGSDTQQWPGGLPPTKVVHCFTARTKKNWWKAWHRRGVPLIVDDDGRRIRLKQRLSAWATYESGMNLSALLQQHDELVMKAGNSDGKYETEKFWSIRCPDCLGQEGLTAEVVPAEPGPCRICGKAGRLQFIWPQTTIY